MDGDASRHWHLFRRFFRSDRKLVKRPRQQQNPGQNPVGLYVNRHFRNWFRAISTQPGETRCDRSFHPDIDHHFFWPDPNITHRQTSTGIRYIGENVGVRALQGIAAGRYWQLSDWHGARYYFWARRHLRERDTGRYQIHLLVYGLFYDRQPDHAVAGRLYIRSSQSAPGDGDHFYDIDCFQHPRRAGA